MPGMKKTMDEFKGGKLHSGSKQGPVVKSRQQAIAIGLSEARAAGKPVGRKGKPSKGASTRRAGDLIRRAAHGGK